MMARFSPLSRGKLEGCDQQLIKVMEKVLDSGYDCSILEGYRSSKKQDEYFKSGKSKVKGGDSKHNTSPSRAVDVSPYPIPKKWGEGNSKEKAKFYHFAGYVLATANSLGVKLRWGGDWDSDNNFNDQTFDDLLHFELI